ncbi:MAG TPA: hypothetical protein PLZ95_13305 [Bryobacteraceae bacterium]|nr:hypothetical protein [Bryobacteraceae bacterium]
MSKLLSALSTFVMFTALVAAEPPLQVQVTANIEFFEHMFATLDMAPETARSTFLSHLGIPKEEHQKVLSVAAEFSSKEAQLRTQAQSILALKGAEQSVLLGSIRAERTELLHSDAVLLMKSLDSGSRQALLGRISQMQKLIPKRVSN